MLNTLCGAKSTGRIATDIARMLEKAGHTCRIGYGAEAVPPSAARFAYRIGNPLERKIHGAIRKYLDAEGYGSSIGTVRLIREMKRFNADIIHMHNLHGCYVNLRILFRYLRKSGVPVVWTLHDCWAMTGHCAYFEYARCDRWEKECGLCPQLRNYPTCLWWDGSKRNLRLKKALFASLPNMTLVTPSKWLGAYLARSWLRAYPARVIYNGVNLSIFAPADGDYLRSLHGIAAKYIILAAAAEWDGRKGLQHLLNAARLLSQKDYQVVIIGLRTDQSASLPLNCIGIPAIHNIQELVAWYSVADCFVNPTLEDNMPLVNLEALACGIPLAVFRTGGCPEVTDETCCRVVEQGNTDALAMAVRELAPQKKHLSTFCLKQAKRFDSDGCYGQYLRLYEELIT